MTVESKKSGRMSAQEQRFVEEYLVDFNAKEAVIRAGYPTRGADKASERLLQQPNIVAAVETAVAARKEKIRVTADRIVEEYAHIAFANLRDFIDWGPKGIEMRPKAALSAADTAAISDIRPNGRGGNGGVKLYDKQAALNALARHLGLFDPKARNGKADLTIDGKDAREVLRERLEKLMQKRDK